LEEYIAGRQKEYLVPFAVDGMKIFFKYKETSPKVGKEGNT